MHKDFYIYNSVIKATLKRQQQDTGEKQCHNNIDKKGNVQRT
jgi:hypothetical protein